MKPKLFRLGVSKAPCYSILGDVTVVDRELAPGPVQLVFGLLVLLMRVRVMVVVMVMVVMFGAMS